MIEGLIGACKHGTSMTQQCLHCESERRQGETDSKAKLVLEIANLTSDLASSMTTRQAFAMAAMQALLSATDSEGTWTGVNDAGAAVQAVIEADALLKALEES